MDINYINEINRSDSYNNIKNYNIRVNHVGLLSTELFELNRISHNYILIYVITNSFLVKSDNKVIKLSVGDVFYLNENLVLVENNNATVIFISFRSYNSIVLSELDDFLSSNIKKVTFDKNEILKNYFQQIYREVVYNNFSYCEVIDSLLGLILIELFRFSKKTHKQVRQSSSNLLFEEALKYIKENLDRPILVSEVSKNLNISNIYLYKIFKSHSDKSVQQFILDFKLSEAANMLETGEYQIKDIAMKFGFSSSNHFSYSFKKKYGTSPKSFVEEHI